MPHFEGNPIPSASIQATERKALVMRNTVFFFVTLLVSAFCLQAQEGDPGADVWLPANTYPPTIDGCLQRLGFYYYVIGKDGTVYNLTHDTAVPSRLNGHEVEITGKPTVISLSTTMVHAASSVEEFPALEVKTVKALSAMCTSPARPVPASCVQPSVECRTPR